MEQAYQLTIKREPGTGLAPVTIRAPKDAVSFILGTGAYNPEDTWREKVCAILLDKGNRAVAWTEISTGGPTCCVFDVRQVAIAAVLQMSSGVILVHNHPSGNPMAGEMDLKQTKNLRRGLATLDIKLVDHIILGETTFFSMAEGWAIPEVQELPDPQEEHPGKTGV